MKNETIGNMKILLKKLSDFRIEHFTVCMHVIPNYDKVTAQLSSWTALPSSRPDFGHLYTLKVYDRRLPRVAGNYPIFFAVDLCLTRHLYYKLRSLLLFEYNFYSADVHEFLTEVQPLKSKLIALKSAIDGITTSTLSS